VLENQVPALLGPQLLLLLLRRPLQQLQHLTPQLLLVQLQARLVLGLVLLPLPHQPCQLP
jgi:hypothetical protein